MKQVLQIVRGILLALVVFDLLLWVGSLATPLSTFFSFAAVPIAAIVLLLCLWLTFIRKGAPKIVIDRQEYLVVMSPGSYGRIGSSFDKTKYGDIQRLPGGFLSGIRTYRAEDGSLLFTVHQRYRPRGSVKRLLFASAVIAVLLVPLSALSHVNAINLRIGIFLNGIGVPIEPDALSYLDTSTIQLFPQRESNINYILPSDTRALTDRDVKDMDAAQIQRAINEMYARYGYDLSHSSDADYFSQQDWYEPDSSVTQSDVRAQFSALENDNLDFLISHRNKLK